MLFDIIKEYLALLTLFYPTRATVDAKRELRLTAVLMLLMMPMALQILRFVGDILPIAKKEKTTISINFCEIIARDPL